MKILHIYLLLICIKKIKKNLKKKRKNEKTKYTIMEINEMSFDLYKGIRHRNAFVIRKIFTRRKNIRRIRFL